MTAEQNKVSPVQKVIQLLDELKGKVQPALQPAAGCIASTGSSNYPMHVTSRYGFFNERKNECLSMLKVFNE